MTTMLERVARAICAELGVAYDELAESADYMERKTAADCLVLDKEEAHQIARAAIEAMRCKDGADEDMFVEAAAPEKIDPVCLICAYGRVIDAALKEG